MSRIKLFNSTILLLCSNSRLPAAFIPKLNISAIFSYSSYHMGKAKVCRYEDFSFTKYTCSLKNFSSESSNVGVARCWNCSAVEPFLVCQNCSHIQPKNQSVDYFRMFGLEKAYEIGDVNLEDKYKTWQKLVHPDLFHTKSEREKAYAAEQSAQVIDAYRTLKTPLLRAIYLLRLEGVHVDEEQTVSEPELLLEIMEIREAVDEAVDCQTLKQIQCQVHEKLERWSKSFEDAFKNRKFDDAITSVHRMKYYYRINEEIMKKL